MRTPLVSSFSRHGSATLGLGIAAMLWSGNFIVSRAIAGEIQPLALNFWRWSIALLVLLPLTAGTLQRHGRTLVRHWKLVAALGLCGMATFHTLIYVAMETTSPVNATLLLSTSPMLVTLGSRLFFREPIRRGQLLGMTISALGAASLIVRGSVDALQTLHLQAGDLWMALGVLCWSAYSLLLKRSPPGLPAAALLSGSAFAAVGMMLPVYLYVGVPPATWTVELVGGVGYMALFSSVVAFFLWNRGVAAVGASRAGVFVYLMPVFGAVLSVSFLGEALQLVQFVGGFAVLAGVLVSNTSIGRDTGPLRRAAAKA